MVRFILPCTLIVIVASRCSCEKLICDGNTGYSFAMTIKAYPDYDTVTVGDTIFFEINSPTTLTDQLSGRSIEYRNAVNLGPLMTVYRIFGKDSLTPAASDIEFILFKGTSSFTDDLTKHR